MIRPGALADATPTLEPSLKLVDGSLGAQNQTALPAQIQSIVGRALREPRGLNNLSKTLRLVIA